MNENNNKGDGVEHKKYKPYIVSVACFVIDEDDYERLKEFLEDNTEYSNYTERETDGGPYVEFELSELECEEDETIEGIYHSKKELSDAEIVQAWLDV